MNIFDQNEQLKDLFQLGDNLKRKPCSNPINILWLLEHAQPAPQFLNEVTSYKNKLKAKLNYFNKNTTRKIRSDDPVGKTILEEKLLISRMEDLVQKGADITQLGNLIVVYKNLAILKKAVSLGVDVNYEEDGNYPLKNAVQHRSVALSQYLYSLSSVDKNKKDNKNNHLAHFAASSKNCFILSQLFKDYPESLYIENDKQETAIDKIFKWKKYDDIPLNSQKLIEPVIYNILDKHYDGSKVLKESTIHRLNSSKMKPMYIEYQKNRFEQKISEKENSMKKMKL